MQFISIYINEKKNDERIYVRSNPKTSDRECCVCCCCPPHPRSSLLRNIVISIVV